MDKSKDFDHHHHNHVVNNKHCHQRGGRNLPSIMNNEYMLFLNDRNTGSVALPFEYRIIFDTGNESLTLVGMEILDELGLLPQVGCVKELQGVGGKADCYEYVKIVCEVVATLQCTWSRL